MELTHSELHFAQRKAPFEFDIYVFGLRSLEIWETFYAHTQPVYTMELIDSRVLENQQVESNN